MRLRIATECSETSHRGNQAPRHMLRDHESQELPLEPLDIAGIPLRELVQMTPSCGPVTSVHKIHEIGTFEHQLISAEPREDYSRTAGPLTFKHAAHVVPLHGQLRSVTHETLLPHSGQ